MNKFSGLFILLILFSLNAEFSFAYCSTGYACSIEDIEKLQVNYNHKFVENMEDYFSKKINEDIFFGKISSSVNYNDIFIFNTIV